MPKEISKVGLPQSINRKIDSTVRDCNRVRATDGQGPITLDEVTRSQIKQNLINLATDDNFIAVCSPGDGAPITRHELLDSLLHLHFHDGIVDLATADQSVSSNVREFVIQQRSMRGPLHPKLGGSDNRGIKQLGSSSFRRGREGRE